MGGVGWGGEFGQALDLAAFVRFLEVSKTVLAECSPPWGHRADLMQAQYCGLPLSSSHQ